MDTRTDQEIEALVNASRILNAKPVPLRDRAQAEALLTEWRAMGIDLDSLRGMRQWMWTGSLTGPFPGRG